MNASPIVIYLWSAVVLRQAAEVQPQPGPAFTHESLPIAVRRGLDVSKLMIWNWHWFRISNYLEHGYLSFACI